MNEQIRRTVALARPSLTAGQIDQLSEELTDLMSQSIQGWSEALRKSHPSGTEETTRLIAQEAAWRETMAGIDAWRMDRPTVRQWWASRTDLPWPTNQIFACQELWDSIAIEDWEIPVDESIETISAKVDKVNQFYTFLVWDAMIGIMEQVDDELTSLETDGTMHSFEGVSSRTLVSLDEYRKACARVIHRSGTPFQEFLVDQERFEAKLFDWILARVSDPIGTFDLWELEILAKFGQNRLDQQALNTIQTQIQERITARKG